MASLYVLPAFVLALLANLSRGVPQLNTSSRLVATYSWEHNPIMKHVDTPGWLKLRALHQDVQDNGCDTNICFLVEASSTITDEDFSNQKNFADLLIAITTTGSGGNFCGALHSRRSTPFATLTGNKLGFLNTLHGLVKPTQRMARGVGSSNLLSALRWGVDQLIAYGDDANKIVAFSKSQPILPFDYASFLMSTFRQQHGSVCAVTLDEKYKRELAILTGDVNKVVNIKGFFDLAEIIVATVADVCAMPCKTRYGTRGPANTPPKPMRTCPNGSTQ